MSADVAPRAMSLLQLDNLLHSAGLDDRGLPGRPVTPAAQLPLGTLPGLPIVTVVGYDRQYNAARELWYVDIAFDPGEHFWPFLRLAVCRYQPKASRAAIYRRRCAVTSCKFHRNDTSVSRTDDRHVRVVVSGTVGVRTPPRPGLDAAAALASAVDENRCLIARLQRRDPLVDTDLGWETVVATRLTLRGSGPGNHEAAWVGELDAGEEIPLVRPGHGPSGRRVAVEEWELLEGDPAHIDVAFVGIDLPRLERRLIYADEIDL